MLRLALAGLLPVLFVASSGAQKNPSVLTEAEFLSVLNEAHPAVIESAEALAHARARAVETRTLENPVVEVVRERPSGSVQQTDVVISWQPPRPARRTTIEAREREVEAASARLHQELQAHRLAMRQAYAEWAVSVARGRRLLQQAERIETLTKREVARAEAGEASGLEAHRLELAVSVLRSRVAFAAADSDLARAAVASWYPDLPIDVRPVLPDLPAAPTLDEATARPNAQVQAAEADLAAARLVREATGRYLAMPAVSLGWQRQESGPDSIGGPIVGLAWSVPLFDRKQAARGAAQASLAAAQARLELTERKVSASRAAARTRYASLSAAFSQASRELAISERMLDGAETAFRHGEASLTDLLETHRSVTEAELATLDLRAAALAAHRELERLAGSAGPVADHQSVSRYESTETSIQENAP